MKDPKEGSAKATYDAASALKEQISYQSQLLQSIRETTVENGDFFWSSTGDKSQDAVEHITYELQGACARIHAVGLRVYRAGFQYGYGLLPLQELHNLICWAFIFQIQLMRQL